MPPHDAADALWERITSAPISTPADMAAKLQFNHIVLIHYEGVAEDGGMMVGIDEVIAALSQSSSGRA
jgi:hypothetical protein